MHPTKEMLAYEAELYRLFPKNQENQDENCYRKPSRFQENFSFFSPPNLSSSAAHSDNIDQMSSFRNPSQHRLSDSICEFNPPFNSSIQEPHSPDVSSCFSPSSEDVLPTHYLSPDDYFSSSSFSSHHYSQFSDRSHYHYDLEKNVAEAIPKQNICTNLFSQPNRVNNSNPVNNFKDRSNSLHNFSQKPRRTFTDNRFLEDMNTPRVFQKTPHTGIAESNLCPTMVTYTPTFQTPTSNFHFESAGLNVPTTVHFLPTAMNIPPGTIRIPSNAVNFSSDAQVPSFTVALSTPVNISPNAIPVSQHINPKMNLLPKVTTPPTVFKVSPNSVKSSSSSTSEDLIVKDKICSFCRKNGENPRVYMTHVVKKRINGKQIVTCPILRSYVCSVCNVSGDNAHTITYCPLLKNAGISIKPTTITLKSTKMKSDGKPRFPQNHH